MSECQIAAKVQPNASLLSIPNRAILILDISKHWGAARWRLLRIFGILVPGTSIVCAEMEQQGWIEAWARRIEALGLASLVLPFIDTAQAFGFLGSQALVLTQPLATGFVSDEALDKAVTLLNDPGLLEQLRSSLSRGEG